MRKLTIAAVAGIAALTLTVAAGVVQAGADRVAFPDGYQKSYKLYGVIDRPDLKIIRYFYVDAASYKASKPGKPMPNGTTLVMADKKAQMGADGQPAVDKVGHMVADGDFFRVLVQKKGKGWGDDHAANMKNGDWEYASFNGDGSRIEGTKFEACFGCHNNRQKPAEDFTFLFAPYLRDHKKS
jgi:Cytochrome P460